MAVADTFSIIFEVANGQGTVKGIKKIEETLKDTEKAANIATKQTGKLGDGFSKLGMSALKALAPMVGFGAILRNQLNFARQGEELLFMANSAGVAAQTFTALALATERLGGTRGGMAASLGNLSRGLQGIRRGEDNGISRAAMYYGVKMGANGQLASPEQMLENIARAMEGRSAAEQMEMGRMMGLDEGTIRLLQQGVAGLRKEMQLAQKYNPWSPEALKDLKQFQYSFRELKAAFAMFTGELAKNMLPHFQRWAEVLKEGFDFLLDHKNEAIAAITAIGVAMLAAFAPIWLIPAALVLLLDDFTTFARGGESALEPLWKMIVKIGDAIEPMLNGMKAVKKFWDNGDNSEAGKIIKNATKSALNPLGAAWESVKSLYGEITNNNTITFNITGGDVNKSAQGVKEGLTEAGLMRKTSAQFATVGK